MRQPNIVLVTTDQQRFDAAQPAGPDFLRTPHLDILAAEGTVFTHGYSDCPICVPARATIMTGRPAFEHGMLKNGKTGELFGTDGTLPTRLRELGYQSLAVGKMHFGPQRVRHGFDEMILPDDYYREMETSGFPLKPMRNGLGQLELYPGMATVPEAMTLTAWTADRCVDFVRYRRDPSMPFFLWCSFAKPHPPFDPPEPYYSMYLDAPIPEPVIGSWSRPERAPRVFTDIAHRRRISGIDPLTMRKSRAAYYGMVTHIDYSLGRLFGALQDAGEWENTLFVYTSDHGEFLGDHGNGGKLFFYEPSAHVPLVVRPPTIDRGVDAPEQVDTAVCLADILPTLVAAGGGSPPESEQSADLLGKEFGDRFSTPADGDGSGGRVIVGTVGYETPCDYVAATDGRWKYIYYPEGPVRQLFDLQNDPQELTDLMDAADSVGQASERLERVMVDRLSAAGSPAVDNGRLIDRRTTSPASGRRRSHYSFHTEHFDGDVRH